MNEYARIMTNSITDKKLSRRQFVEAAAGGAAALGAVAGASALIPSVAAVPTAEASKVSAIDKAELRKPTAASKMLPNPLTTVVPSSWDYTGDVVVVGMGFAGLATAITASDLGANVILIDKGDQNTAGGNSHVCGQCTWVPGTDEYGNQLPKSSLFNNLIYFEQMADGQGFPTDDDLIQTLVNNCYDNKNWFESLGGTTAWMIFPQPFYPQFDGASAESLPYGGSWTVPGTHSYGNLWYFMLGQVQKRPINVMYSTPAVSLVQNPTTREILGVVANPAGASTINIAAKKAVVLCTGGYEHNDQMVRDYIGIPNVKFYGTPLNTGDGIVMAQAAGAALWHMDVYAAPTGWSTPTPPYQASVQLSTPSKGGYIYLGADSKRFCNETQTPGPFTSPSPNTTVVLVAGKYLSHGVYTTPFYPQPVHMIFDSVGFGSGSLFGGGPGGMGWIYCVEGYGSDPTNKTQLASGWISSASTLSALATTIGKDPTIMPAEVTNWNTMVAAGTDTEFGRTTGLTAISTPPYYAILLEPLIYNTQGGPVRNSSAEILDANGNPIPRLYSAGENGEVFSYLYQCCRNVSACFTMGRIAGKNAVGLTSWE